MGTKRIRAAGGVVVDRDGSTPRVLLVHRPSYDDWTHPKGKLDNGERHRDAALREVEEETGLRCMLVCELSAVEYVDLKGRDKRVRYWLMLADDPTALRTHVDEEIDDVRWLPLDEAADRLSYPHDRALLAEAATALGLGDDLRVDAP